MVSSRDLPPDASCVAAKPSWWSTSHFSPRFPLNSVSRAPENIVCLIPAFSHQNCISSAYVITFDKMQQKCPSNEYFSHILSLHSNSLVTNNKLPFLEDNVLSPGQCLVFKKMSCLKDNVLSKKMSCFHDNVFSSRQNPVSKTMTCLQQEK